MLCKGFSLSLEWLETVSNSKMKEGNTILTYISNFSMSSLLSKATAATTVARFGGTIKTLDLKLTGQRKVPGKTE